MNSPAPGASAPLVAIGHTQLSILFFRETPVITFALMDQAHERPEGTARRNFNRNRDKLVEHEDYFVLGQPDEIRSVGLAREDGSTPASIVLLTETGYLMLVKSFTDDLAWQVQRQLVTGYFRAKPPRVSGETITPEQLAALSQAMTEALAGIEFYEASCRQWVHQRLKNQFQVEKVEHLSPAQFPHAMADLERLKRDLSAYFSLRQELSRWLREDLIGLGLPWTPYVARRWREKMQKEIPPRPDWLQMAREVGLWPKEGRA